MEELQVLEVLEEIQVVVVKKVLEELQVVEVLEELQVVVKEIQVLEVQVPEKKVLVVQVPVKKVLVLVKPAHQEVLNYQIYLNQNQKILTRKKKDTSNATMVNFTMLRQTNANNL